MGLKDEQRAVGREGFVVVCGLEVSVIVLDVRVKTHAVDYLVEPTAGKGRVWMDGGLVRIAGWSERV